MKRIHIDCASVKTQQTKRSAMGIRLLVLYIFFSVNYFSISATYCSYTYDARCSYDQICCNNVCVYGTDCIGRYCVLDSDCAIGENCCDNTCESDCGVDTGIIVGAVISILFGIFMICVIVICCRRRRLQLVQRPIVGQRVITQTTTTTTRNYRPVPNYQQQPYQQPYGYQQGYMQPPIPPQYPGYGATNPVTGVYQSGSNPAPQPNMAAARPPPPYEEVPAVVNLGKENTDQKPNYAQATAPPM